MLRSAGFEVDVVTLPSPHFRHRIGLRTVKRLPDRRSLLVAAAELDRVRPYDWIIIGDDDTSSPFAIVLTCLKQRRPDLHL